MPIRLTEIFHRWLAPGCAGCGGPSPVGLYCQPCLDALPTNDHACIRCAEPLPPSAPKPALCAHCLTRWPAFDGVYAPLLYEAPVDACVQVLKYRHDLGAARRLATLLHHTLPELPAPDRVIPVPLHASRLRERGFNQALEIARPLCRWRGWPLAPAWVERTRATPSQLHLSAEDRRRNLRQAFTVRRPVQDEAILVIDDVVTTGATTSALAKALFRAGAASVHVLAAARTPFDHAPGRSRPGAPTPSTSRNRS